MGLMNKLCRVKPAVMVGLVSVLCIATYYFTMSKEEISDTNDHIHASKHSRNIVIQVTPPAGHDDPQQRNLSAVTPDNHASTSGESAKDREVKGGLLLSSEAGLSGFGGESELERSGLEISVSELAAAGMRGKLNYDLWRWIVGYTVDDMRIDHSYPNHPDERRTIDHLHVTFDEKDAQDIRGKYSHRVYGYLLPPSQGVYQFSVEMTNTTASGSVEVWLSTDSNPLNMHKMVAMEHPRRATHKRSESQPIQLDSTAHYFEYLQKAYEGRMQVDIQWKLPDREEFVVIDSKSFAMAVKFSSSSGKALYGPHVELVQGRLPSNELQIHRHVQFVGDTVYPISELDVLPRCEFKAAYAYPRKLRRYAGFHQVYESRVYPIDETWHRRWGREGRGNGVIDNKTADHILSLYNSSFNANKKYKGQVIRLHYLEETVNRSIGRYPRVFGSRFLVELDVKLVYPVNQLLHTSEYVYLPANSTRLCHASNFQWRKSPPVDVYLVVSLKNLGVWVDHLIHNMEEIYAATKDDHFELVLVDYESQDMDVEEKLRTSSVNRWQVIKKTGSFSRSGGLQAGIDSVNDPNSIVMTIDMHLTLPRGFVEYIRRHTIQGKMACTPFFFRLNKGFTEVNLNGFWELLTYGLFSMFKSDWEKVGGFNLDKYKDSWGGEDWDLLDRVLSLGYEAFRIRYPGLVHYHHTKAGMWMGGGADGRPRR